MLRRMIIPALFGLLGCWILVSLGLWQLDRADQKAALIAEMEGRIFQPPQPLPPVLEPEADRYMPVEIAGRFLPEHVFILSARRSEGPGFHLVQAFEAEDGRRIMVERGFLTEAARADPALVTTGPAQLSGNLHWPRDTNRHTPAYDAGRNLAFGRDVRELAQVLQTEEILLVLRQSAPAHPVINPVPVYNVSVPDPHFGYAVQWFLMALAWAGMTVFFLWRIRAQHD
jgi:surfeit locus 1 family protein